MKKSKKILKYIVLFSVILTILFLYYQMFDEVQELIKLKDNPLLMRKYLRKLGPIAGVFVVLLEFLQLIVVFVPAEFIQIAAALTFPYPIALLLCILGICLGATVIYLLVHMFNIKLSYLEKRTEKLGKIVSKINHNASMATIMYILFVMPLIPFGAICYFASSSKIKYRKYIFTVATGVIPSITTSYVVGHAMFLNLGNPIKMIIVAILLSIVMGFILSIMVYFLKRKYFKKNVEKPNIVIFMILYYLVLPFITIRNKLSFDKTSLRKIKGPAIVLGTHSSAYDVFYLSKALRGRRFNCVTNRYYFEYHKTKNLMNHLGTIPKSLFTNDLETVKKIIYASKDKRIIALWPAARLSSVPKPYPVANGTFNLIKKLEIDVYYCNAHGGYFVNPKWSTKRKGGKVKYKLEKVFDAAEIKDLSVEEIKLKVNKLCSTIDTPIPDKSNRYNIEGIENLLYKCPNCLEEYHLHTFDKTIKCDKCGFTSKIDNMYTFNNGPHDITAWYEFQKQQLINDLDTVEFKEMTILSKFDSNSGKMVEFAKGYATLNKEEFKFVGTEEFNEVIIEMKLKDLQALAYGSGEEVEFYYENELCYFYLENKKACVKWALLVDIVKEKQENESKSNRIA